MAAGVYLVKKAVMQGKWDEGFSFYGPFETDEEAEDFLGSFYNNPDDPAEISTIIDLLVPEDDK